MRNIFTLTVLALCLRCAWSDSVTLAWDASPDAGVASYRVHYGVTSSIYTNATNAGTATQLTVKGLTKGVTYYFAATAIGTNLLESDFSNEISYLLSTNPPAGEPKLLSIELDRVVNYIEVVDETFTNSNGVVFNSWTNTVWHPVTNVIVRWPQEIVAYLQYAEKPFGATWINSPTWTNNPAHFNITQIPQAYFRIIETNFLTIDTNTILSLSFNEGTGTIAYDSSPNEYNGNLSNAAWVDGYDGFGLYFDGSISGVNLPPINIDGNSLNVSVWIFPYSFNTSDGRIISKAFGNATQDHIWMLSTVNYNGGIKARFRLKMDDNYTSMIYGNTVIPDNLWTHIRGSYDGTNMSIFVNDILESSLGLSGGLYQDTNTPVSIGINPNGYAPFHGLIDEVIISR